MCCVPIQLLSYQIIKSMDDPYMHIAKWQRPICKVYKLWFQLYDILGKDNTLETFNIKGCQKFSGHKGTLNR